jgi:hypothetical protein
LAEEFNIKIEEAREIVKEWRKWALKQWI